MKKTKMRGWGVFLAVMLTGGLSARAGDDAKPAGAEKPKDEAAAALAGMRKEAGGLDREMKALEKKLLAEDEGLRKIREDLKKAQEEAKKAQEAAKKAATEVKALEGKIRTVLAENPDYKALADRRAALQEKIKEATPKKVPIKTESAGEKAKAETPAGGAAEGKKPDAVPEAGGGK